ncbi:MAG: substrate-binding domain-containing protein [Cyanobacteria bacterium P01_D01_bin.36]
MSNTRKILTSSAIALTALALAYTPIPGAGSQSIVIVSGSELQEPLTLLEKRFEQQYPDIDLDLKFQGSQDIVNNYIDDNNKFSPTVLIPANGEVLTDLSERWEAQNSESAFLDDPQPVANTLLVAVAWSDRAQVLFPNGQFNWQPLEEAIEKGSWSAIGGDASWGSFDFVTTDPTRSNSGQLALSLWAQAKTKSSSIEQTDFSSADVQTLFGAVKRSVYQPPRSTDILLQEFIARGPSDADVAMVYESIAIHRWDQSQVNQPQPYQVLYPNPTIETTSTAAIARRDVTKGQAKAARTFIDFLTETDQQAVFVQYGFRPVNASVDVSTVPDSPWAEPIPGVEFELNNQVTAAPDRAVTEEVIRQWQRSQ